MTTYIDIDPNNGLAVPEGRIASVVYALVCAIQIEEPIEKIGQQELILGIRLAVKKGQIKDVAFRFNGFIIPIMPDGQLYVYPLRFPGSVFNSILNELLE